MTRSVKTNWLRGVAALLVIALLSGCEALSWGTDGSGQLGDGVIGGSRVAPGNAAAGFTWLSLEAGWNHTCGIDVDRKLWCWGENNRGQLGVGYEDIDSAVPLQVGTAADWLSVSPGNQHTCGIRAGGQLWCWGRGGSGQLGDGLATDSPAPVRVGTFADWKEVSAGGFRYTCGIRGQGDLYCWGDNGYGQLGLGDYTDRSVPVQLAASPWKGVSAGAWHTCAIAAVTNVPFCWGRNDAYQIDIGGDAALPSPVEIKLDNGQITVYQVAAGFDATCLLLATRIDSDEVKNLGYCLGAERVNGTVQSPDFVYVGSEEVQNPNELPRFRYLSLTTSHACGILSDGSNEALCWGDGAAGQLGNGVAADSELPVPVAGGRQWWTVSAGSNFTVGLEVPEL